MSRTGEVHSLVGCYLLQYVVPHARFVPVILHFFSPIGWEQWDLCERPFIRDKMPVLIDEDLRFEDGRGPRPATVMNRWLRELAISGAPSPNSWRTYAQALKSWTEYLGARPILLACWPSSPAPE